MLMAILHKQGFPDNIIRFFASYLVGRATAYCWGLHSSPLMNADVGVGQGSALSPVLSALYIAPLMELYDLRAARLGLTLLSYVDDGLIIAQSSTVTANLPHLKGA